MMPPELRGGRICVGLSRRSLTFTGKLGIDLVDAYPYAGLMKRKPAHYRPCVLAFFDILGFREMVEELPAVDIENRVHALQDFSGIHKESAELFEAQSFQFSDCVVRVMPIDSKANREAPVGILFHEILAIVHAQLEMANKGVFLRGGLTMGSAYFEGSVLFGPAMVAAYELESKIAIFPRVVIDPKLIIEFRTNKLLKKDTHSLKDEVGYLRKLLRKDRDGFWFIDYLFAAGTECDEPERYVELLRNHRTAIEEKLAKRKRADGVVQKLNWAVRYHNSVIKRLEKEGFSPDLASELRMPDSATFSPALP